MYIKNSNLNTNIMMDLSSNGFNSTDDNFNFDFKNDQNKQVFNSNSQVKSYFCPQCFNPLNIYQINYTEAIKICTNLQCLTNNDQSKFNLNESSNVFKRDVNEITQSIDLRNFFNEQEYIDYESTNLNIILNNQLNYQDTKLNSNLYKFEQTKQQPKQEQQLNFDFLSTNLDNFDQFNNLDYQNQPNLNQQIQTNEPINLISPQSSSCLFDDNFFSEINNFLAEDYSYQSNDQFSVLPDSQQMQQQKQIIQDQLYKVDSQESFRSILTNDFDMNLPQNVPEKNLVSLQSVNKTDLASKLANDMLDYDFMNANSKIESPIKKSNYEQVIAHSESKSGKTKITITKLNNSSVEPKQKNEFKISNFKIIDEKDELEALFDSNSNKSVDNDKLNDLKSKVSDKKQPIKQNSLLPWEVKSKDYKRKPKIESKLSSGSNTSLNTSISKLKPNGVGIINRISRDDLVKKSNESQSNIKELGSVLKNALLNDSSFLSNLNNSNHSASPVKNTSSGGYKDLVLSVLKKKNSTTTA